jgi:hypothetical protein
MFLLLFPGKSRIVGERAMFTQVSVERFAGTSGREGMITAESGSF